MAKLNDAKVLAKFLIEEMEGAVDRAMIAGSIRRGKQEVKDIEIVAIPSWTERTGDAKDMFSDPEIIRTNTLWLWALSIAPVRWIKTGTPDIIDWVPKEDGKYWRGIVPINENEDIKLDLFLANPLNWGVIATIRTGPREFSEALMATIKAGGATRVKDGHLIDVRNDNQIIPCETEESFFQNAGIEFIPVQERSATDPYSNIRRISR